MVPGVKCSWDGPLGIVLVPGLASRPIPCEYARQVYAHLVAGGIASTAGVLAKVLRVTLFEVVPLIVVVCV